jgi:hypothetical protein
MAENAIVVYRQRRAVVIPAAIASGLLAGLLSVILIRIVLPKAGFLSILWGAVAAMYSARRVVLHGRRGTLTVTEDGLEAQRDLFRLIVRWEDFEKAEKRTVGGIRTDLLTFRVGEIASVTSTGKRTKVNVERIRKAGADRSIQVGIYVKDWKTSPIADRLKESHGDWSTSL